MNQKPITVFLLLLVGLLISACGMPVAQTSSAAPATATPATATTAPVALPTATATAVPTSPPTVMPTATQAPPPAAGAVQVNSKDGMEMVYVPAGGFTMGATEGTVDEQPVHTVNIDAYWIDKTEVTNAMYNLCVQAGVCVKPSERSNTHNNYFTAPKYVNFPVITIKWSSADKYCNWAGQRLPTEAEWEKAARGTDGRTYPWGKALPTNDLLNFNNPAGDVVQVGSYKLGASPFGALDMAGNVREWVSDWYDANYYTVSPGSNPTGPATGQYKVVRGGSWHSSIYLVRSADRTYLAPDTSDFTVGFRCVMPAP